MCFTFVLLTLVVCNFKVCFLNTNTYENLYYSVAAKEKAQDVKGTRTHFFAFKNLILLHDFLVRNFRYFFGFVNCPHNM